MHQATHFAFYNTVKSTILFKSLQIHKSQNSNLAIPKD